MHRHSISTVHKCVGGVLQDILRPKIRVLWCKLQCRLWILQTAECMSVHSWTFKFPLLPQNMCIRKAQAINVDQYITPCSYYWCRMYEDDFCAQKYTNRKCVMNVLVFTNIFFKCVFYFLMLYYMLVTVHMNDIIFCKLAAQH